MSASGVRRLFERYERAFRSGLHGDPDPEEAASLYAPAFIAATPAGVVCGSNDEQLAQVMAKGYERYRAMGTKDMRIRELRISPIDAHHSIVHVGWTATYARDAPPDVAIDFEVHYLVQELDADAKVFGWISGDEQALLEKHGIRCP